MIKLEDGPCAGQEIQVWVITGHLKHQPDKPGLREVWACRPAGRDWLVFPVYHCYELVGGVWCHQPQMRSRCAAQ